MIISSNWGIFFKQSGKATHIADIDIISEPFWTIIDEIREHFFKVLGGWREVDNGILVFIRT
jgi:hypothetical protein